MEFLGHECNEAPPYPVTLNLGKTFIVMYIQVGYFDKYLGQWSLIEIHSVICRRHQHARVIGVKKAEKRTVRDGQVDI